MPTTSKSSSHVMQIRLAVGVTLRPTGEPLREQEPRPRRLTEESSQQAAPAPPTTTSPRRNEKTLHRQAKGDIKIGARLLLSHNIRKTSKLLQNLRRSSRHRWPKCNLLLVRLILSLLPLLLLCILGTSGQLQRPLGQALFNGAQLLQQQPPFQPPTAFLHPQSLASLVQQPPPQMDTKPTQSSARGGTNLEAPPAMYQQYSQGPGVDLVALNRRRFELNHQHSSGSSETDMQRGELIESYLASVPDRLLANLPENVDRQILETLAVDTSFFAGDSSSPASGSKLTAIALDEPDGASIERLTKSCMSVHASSNKPEQLNVTFHLYTKNNPQVAFIIRPQITRLELIKSSPLDPSRPIKWITHGFHTNVDKSEWMVEAKDKILAFEDSNVILTDWRRGASPALAFYPKAAANAHVVAKMIVKILRRLRNDIDFSRIHLIGHSLGAHIMGFVGSAFTEEYLYQKQQLLASGAVDGANKRPFWQEIAPIGGGQTVGTKPMSLPAPYQLVGRITACDPALPCFGPLSNAPATGNAAPAPEATGAASPTANLGAANLAFSDTSDWTPSMWTHLRPDSAVVVEVIHSNPGVMGYTEPLGDYDFYPNGLERQPGCGASQQPEMGGGQFVVGARSKRQIFPAFMSSWFGKRVSPSQEPSRLTSTLDRFIKPIREFFTGYTCSHHRSVEYMVESMYYERIPQDRKLDKNFVCQMVGYRCKDYVSFKRGFCFECTNELDCRAFTMSVGPLASPDWGKQIAVAFTAGQQISASARSLQTHLDKFQVPAHTRHGQPPPANDQLNETRPLQSAFKRVIPTFNQYSQNYLPLNKNQYFFDTRSTKEYCAHHYHLFIKYRWFRVRDSVIIDGFRIQGTLANITHLETATLNRFTYQSYTMLLVESAFLGQVESLVVLGDKIKSMFVEYIEITYMSNLDPRVRALGSARLCRQATAHDSTGSGGNLLLDSQSNSPKLPSVSYFVRCSGSLV